MNRKTQTMTERLAEFVTELTYEQIPEHVIETQKKSVLDTLGITYGALPLGNGCQAMIGLAEECAAGGSRSHWNRKAASCRMGGFCKRVYGALSGLWRYADARSCTFECLHLSGGVGSRGEERRNIRKRISDGADRRK